MLLGCYLLLSYVGQVTAMENEDAAYYIENLWLPISYQQHYTRLLKSAEHVSANAYCDQLLEGTLYESKSSTHSVVFRFRCRTAERKLFTISVDEKTLTLTNSLADWINQQALEKEGLKQENLVKEQLIEKDELKKKMEARKQYWKICNEVFTRKANLFNSTKVTSQLPPQLDISDDGGVTYYIYFQALSAKKTVLRYLATARINSSDGCDVDIRSV